jgi:hypothetical protein
VHLGDLLVTPALVITLVDQHALAPAEAVDCSQHDPRPGAAVIEVLEARTTEAGRDILLVGNLPALLAPRLLSHHVDANIGGDLGEPRPHRPVVKTGKGAVDFDQRLLKSVLSLRGGVTQMTRAIRAQRGSKLLVHKVDVDRAGGNTRAE